MLDVEEVRHPLLSTFLARAQITLFFLLPLGILCIVLKYYRGNTVKKALNQELDLLDGVKANIEITHKRHPTAECLQQLVEAVGAGDWPPRASYGDAWPQALRPYHNIYLELAPSLPQKEVSNDDVVNFARCLNYRAQMWKLLQHHVNLTDVIELLSAAENGDTEALSAVAWNGLFACIALSRHAFR